MLEKMKNIAYEIDASDKTTHIITLLQVLGGVSAFLYSRNSNSPYAKYIVYAFIFFYTVVIIVLILRTIVSYKYGTLKLYLNKNTGILMDKKARFRNVSLRQRTIQLILDSFCTRLKSFEQLSQIEDYLYQTGQRVGKNFYNRLVDHLKKSEKKFDTLDYKNKLLIWANYDSSAGMGKFEIGEVNTSPKIKLAINVQNSFTCLKKNEENVGDYNLCKFLCGYISGFCSELFGKNVSVVEEECGKKATDAKCNFIIFEK